TRTPARRHRSTYHGKGGADPPPRRWPLRARGTLHRRRPGHRHGAGGGMIGRVAVIGAGTMGSGIAAHVARAGVPVVLLDLDGIAQAAVERAGSPPLITPGSLENA